MAHVKTQVRNAVIAQLRAEFGADFVVPAIRLARGLQSHNLPLVAVTVSATKTGTDNNGPGERIDRYDFTIGVRACVSADGADPESDLETIDARIQKTLFDPSVLGIGGTINWRCGGQGDIDAQDIEDGFMLAATTTYTTGMLTMDSDPETNIHA